MNLVKIDFIFNKHRLIKVKTVKRDQENFLWCLLKHDRKAKTVFVNVILNEVLPR
jgi:hypothetical protein